MTFEPTAQQVDRFEQAVRFVREDEVAAIIIDASGIEDEDYFEDDDTLWELLVLLEPDRAEQAIQAIEARARENQR